VKKRRPGVVSVVLVNYRGTDDTITSVEGLRALDWPAEDLEIVIVENGSGDDSLERLKALGDDVKVIDAKKNLGFAGGCNLGVAKSSGEYVAFLNNDARPDAEWIRAAIDTFAEGEDIGAVASKVLDWEGDDVDYVDAAVTWFGMGYKPHAGEKDRGSWDEPKDVLFGTGAAMFIRASLFEQLNGFDESYFMFYEDVDLGWRLNLLGYRFRFTPASLAFHKHHASMEKFSNYHETYLLERNALFTLYKNLGDETLASVLPASLLLTIRRATGRGRVDTTSLDLRTRDDEAPVAETSKQLLAGVYAIDQFVEQLPHLDAERRRIQASRVPDDRQLRLVFGNVDEPAYPIDSYLEGYEKIVSALGVLEDAPRRRILIITGDPIGERMAGPAIRAWNIATLLAKEHDVRLVSMTKAESQDQPFELGVISHHRPSSVEAHEAWADIIIVQGHALGLFPALEVSSKVLVVDIYDPLHLEQLEQGRGKRLELWNKQIADATEVLNHQLRLGDFFLCASERQRHFWLGQLAALGRVNAFTYTRDNDLDSLIAVAPFGISSTRPRSTRPVLRGVVPGIGDHDKVIIWAGGIYNWFDPETLIRVVGRLSETRDDIRLFFMGTQHPNPDVPEMAAALRSRVLADELGLTGKVVFFNDSWVAYDDRQNYLLESDLGVSTHFQHVETTFSFRTRILDYLWAGLPIVTTGGDPFGDLVERNDLGASVPERDENALLRAIDSVLYDPARLAIVTANVERVRKDFEWERVLAPLVEFCRHPSKAADKKPETVGSTVRLSAAPRAVKRRTGLRRDVERAMYYLKEGGVGSVLDRYRARRRRRRDVL
jgi:GT2 family glycosyltransferase